MRSYEIMYIVRPDLDEEKLTAVNDKISNIITSEGGEVVKVDSWGKRQLAYMIDDKWSEGFYVLVYFNGETAVIDELNRVIKLTEEVIRYMITRIEEKK